MGEGPLKTPPTTLTWTRAPARPAQECPEAVPMGELPRSMQLVVDRTLVGTIAPGTRVTAIGIYSIYQARPGIRPPAAHAAVRTCIASVKCCSDL